MRIWRPGRGLSGVVVAILFWGCAAMGQVTAVQIGETITVTGILQRVVAIGGETPGWAVHLDRAVRIAGRTYTTLEVDPAGQDLASYAGQRVRITGRLEMRTGVERGDYPVLVVHQVQ